MQKSPVPNGAGILQRFFPFMQVLTGKSALELPPSFKDECARQGAAFKSSGTSNAVSIGIEVGIGADHPQRGRDRPGTACILTRVLVMKLRSPQCIESCHGIDIHIPLTRG